MVSNRAFIWVIIATVAFLLGPYLWFHTRSIPVDSPGDGVNTDFSVKVRKQHPNPLAGKETNSVIVWLDQRPMTINPVVKVDGQNVSEYYLYLAAFEASRATTGTWVIRFDIPKQTNPPKEVNLTIDGQPRSFPLHPTTSARSWTTRVFWLYENRPKKWPPMLFTTRFEEGDFRQELSIPEWCTHVYVRNLPNDQKVVFGRVRR